MPPNYVPAEVPVAGNVVTVMLQMVTFGVLAFGLSKFSFDRDLYESVLTTLQQDVRNE